MFMDTKGGGMRCQSFFCIEINSAPRKWTLLGGEEGVYKFTDEAERDAKMNKLQGLEAKAS